MGRKVDLRMLEYFVAVVRHGSIKQAANSLGVSSPAISMHLAEMECILSIQLLNRESRPLRPTPQGLQFYQDAEYLLSEARGVFERIHQKKKGLRERLRLGVGTRIIHSFIPYITSALSDKAESLNITAGRMSDLGQDLENQKLDMLVAMSTSYDERLISTELLRERCLLITPADWGDKVDFQTLINRRDYLRHSPDTILGRMIETAMRSRQFSPKSKVEVDHPAAVLSLVATGKGWSLILPSTLLLYQHLLHRVRIQPVQEVNIYRSISLSMDSRRDNDLAFAQECADAIRDSLEMEFFTSLKKCIPWINKTYFQVQHPTQMWVYR